MLVLIQARVAMATADVNIVVLTNQKARLAPATRSMFYGMTYTPVKVRTEHLQADWLLYIHHSCCIKVK